MLLGALFRIGNSGASPCPSTSFGRTPIFGGFFRQHPPIPQSRRKYLSCQSISFGRTPIFGGFLRQHPPIPQSRRKYLSCLSTSFGRTPIFGGFFRQHPLISLSCRKDPSCPERFFRQNHPIPRSRRNWTISASLSEWVVSNGTLRFLSAALCRWAFVEHTLKTCLDILAPKGFLGTFGIKLE